MANSWFQFKQFKIEQAKTAMKVGTDGVLLGAWAEVSDAKKILDIGTGTGLLAMMIAQRNSEALIDAVEIEPSAVSQAKDNVVVSAWSDRIEVHHNTIQSYAQICESKYDLIITNPPYFQNSFSSSNKQKQLARHTESLSSEDLIFSVISLLNKDGVFALVLPSNQADSFIELAKDHNLYLTQQLLVFPKNNVPEKRRLMAFSLVKPKEIVSEYLTIEPEQRHQYSETYKNLTQDFYL